jgi:hypothetical protein
MRYDIRGEDKMPYAHYGKLVAIYESSLIFDAYPGKLRSEVVICS